MVWHSAVRFFSLFGSPKEHDMEDEQLRKLVEIDVRLKHLEQVIDEIKECIRGKDLHARIIKIEGAISLLKWIVGFAIPAAIAILEVFRRLI